MLLNFAKEFEEEHKRHKIEKDPELKEIVLNRLSESLDENNEEFDYIEVKQKPQFDCESILSTYSNIYNRPKIIDESNVSNICCFSFSFRLIFIFIFVMYYLKYTFF